LRRDPRPLQLGREQAWKRVLGDPAVRRRQFLATDLDDQISHRR
jgi:hypothetical protein